MEDKNFFTDGTIESFSSDSSGDSNGDVVSWEIDDDKRVSYNMDEIRKIEEVYIEEK